MKKTHTQQNGKTIYIAEMTSSHLANTVCYICKQIITVFNSRQHNTFAARMNGLPSADDNRVIAKIESLLDAIAPYVQEAVLRNIDLAVFQDTLRTVYGRKFAVDPITSLLVDDANLYEDYYGDDDYLGGE